MENFLIYFKFLDIFLDSATSPFAVKITNTGNVFSRKFYMGYKVLDNFFHDF